jgi:replicative DNA helicase
MSNLKGKVDLNGYIPVLKTRREINLSVIERINAERSGKQLGLKTRFSHLNIALGKYVRFSQVILIAGLSGHGKSTLLNMLLDDFLNKDLNKDFKEDVIVVHNSFEMTPDDETIRTVSSKLNRSHLSLLSAEWTKADKKTKTQGSYNRISDEEVKQIERVLSEEEDKNHYFFDEATTVAGLIANRNAALEYYKEHNPGKPRPKVVNALDHSLLVIGGKGENTLETMSNIGRAAIALKKRGDLTIIVGQLNNNIESTERIKNADLQYPIKSDIYAQGQLYNACDVVLVGHQPEMLGIIEYGKNKLSTALLFHLQALKQRFGKAGSIWLRNELHRGQLVQFKPVSNLQK